MIAADTSANSVLSRFTTQLRSPEDTTGNLAARILAVISRPNSQYFGDTLDQCDCAGCKAIRARGMECVVCGYSGASVVEPCECRENKESNLAYLPKAIAELEAGIVHPNGWSVESLPRMKAELAKWEAMPDGLCRPSASDRQRVHQRAAGKPQCGHGMIWCPSCCDMDLSGQSINDAGPFLEKFKAIYAILRDLDGGRAHEAPSRSRSAEAKAIDVRRGVRQFESFSTATLTSGANGDARDPVPAGEIRVLFDQPTPDSNRGWLSIDVASAEGYLDQAQADMTGEQFDRMVDHLIAVRDRARREGLLDVSRS